VSCSASSRHRSVSPIGLPRGREQVVGVRQAGLNLTDDRAEKTRRQKPRPEGTGRVLTDRGKLSQGGSDRRRHTAKLPANLLADSVRPVGGGHSGGLGGIRRSTKSVRAHMRDACGLPCRPGGRRRWGAHVTSGASSNEAAADLLWDAKLDTRKRPCPCEGITRAVVLRSLSFKQSKHPLRAVRRPSRDDPPVSFAQRLRRTHTETLPRVSLPGLSLLVGARAVGRVR
jgi:hypothetical protein